MNEQLRPASLPGTTQAAEGLPRRRWSVAEIREMVAKGIILEDERFELTGGEVVPMSPYTAARDRFSPRTSIRNLLFRKMLPNAFPLLVREQNHPPLIADRQPSAILR
jgi:hypothetical protein